MRPRSAFGGQPSRGVVLLAGTLAVFLLAGCGKKVEVPVPVKGKVTNAQGKPIANAMLTFHPQEEVNKKEYPQARLDADGTFSFTCIRGRYKVTIAPLAKGLARGMPGASAPVAPPPLESPIPVSVRSAGSTTLEVTIPEGGTDNLVLKVSS
jgi:hypothetical protein